MVVVARRVEPGREVTLGADGVARDTERGPMGLMTVRAGHARALHPALDEGPPLVDLAERLPIRMVEPGLEERGHVGVEEGLAVGVGVDDRPPPGVAPRANVELARDAWRSGPLGDAPLGVLDHPRAVAPPEGHDEPGGAGRRPGCARPARLGPGHVGRGGARDTPRRTR